MIKIDKVKRILNKEEKLSFEEIFNQVKDTVPQHEDESVMKSDLYISMISSSDLIMIGENHWALRKNYSSEEIERIKKINLGITDSSVQELEASEETKEIKLGE